MITYWLFFLFYSYFFLFVVCCCCCDSIICFNLAFLRTEIAMPLFCEHVQKCISAIKHNKTNIESESSLANCVHIIIWPIEFLASLLLVDVICVFFHVSVDINWQLCIDLNNKKTQNTHFSKHFSLAHSLGDHFRLFLFLFHLPPRQTSSMSRNYYENHIYFCFEAWLKAYIPSFI